MSIHFTGYEGSETCGRILVPSKTEVTSSVFCFSYLNRYLLLTTSNRLGTHNTFVKLIALYVCGGASSNKNHSGGLSGVI